MLTIKLIILLTKSSEEWNAHQCKNVTFVQKDIKNDPNLYCKEIPKKGAWKNYLALTYVCQQSKINI